MSERVPIQSVPVAFKEFHKVGQSLGRDRPLFVPFTHLLVLARPEVAPELSSELAAPADEFIERSPPPKPPHPEVMC
jgi:hypothetical protein